ncbi:MAG: FAD-dependent oxidoreductase [Myxococcota bacterium]|nr:FAD-dependent oxidoreductase [bacterium]MDP6076544.1 FAD-dependent oxidoreductase [Myxococcota bacterium]MDP6242367.1 FAD-dependent oxidoreductase [Myxococcota bacterium]MDP7075146.1 FAD-dependent oxidoreductase [Myxococcota bacterium]MDP7299372.1 FAD-dependent oxidoreductase [Myxococcota bacterium]
MAHTSPSHCVAVIGGAVAGAEIAGALADGGADVVVFEQNPRPYGKIEDGLPRWHVALRRKEYGAITRHLSKPGVHYVPHTQVGRDVSFAELVNDWGFSGVVLANGAWRDRTLPVEGADDYIDKGLVYQNPFVIWFNHMNEAAYDGQTFDVHDGTIVVGGGLASIDVAKILMLETTRAKLAERGIEVAMLDLEVKGIPKILERHELAFEDLGLEGCTIYYRRDIEDMPLAEIPKGADAARTKKVRASRRKLLEKAMGKYRFSIEPLCMPDGLIVEDDRLAGLRFRRTKMENGRPVPTDETFERRGPQVISSIGSIPLAIEGIPMKGDLIDFVDWDLGRLAQYPSVFATGNVATGKGNIVASRKHAKALSLVLLEAFLGLGEDRHAGEEKLADAAREAARERAAGISAEIQRQPAIDAATLEALRRRVAGRQQEVGYTGDFGSWIEKVTPPDLE